jgi:hypothetical protein
MSDKKLEEKEKQKKVKYIEDLILNHTITSISKTSFFLREIESIRRILYDIFKLFFYENIIDNKIEPEIKERGFSIIIGILRKNPVLLKKIISSFVSGNKITRKNENFREIMKHNEKSIRELVTLFKSNIKKDKKEIEIFYGRSGADDEKKKKPTPITTEGKEQLLPSEIESESLSAEIDAALISDDENIFEEMIGSDFLEKNFPNINESKRKLSPEEIDSFIKLYQLMKSNNPSDEKKKEQLINYLTNLNEIYKNLPHPVGQPPTPDEELIVDKEKQRLEGIKKLEEKQILDKQKILEEKQRLDKIKKKKQINIAKKHITESVQDMYNEEEQKINERMQNIEKKLLSFSEKISLVKEKKLEKKKKLEEKQKRALYGISKVIKGELKEVDFKKNLLSLSTSGVPLVPPPRNEIKISESKGLSTPGFYNPLSEYESKGLPSPSEIEREIKEEEEEEEEEEDKFFSKQKAEELADIIIKKKKILKPTEKRLTRDLIYDLLSGFDIKKLIEDNNEIEVLQAYNIILSNIPRNIYTSQVLFTLTYKLQQNVGGVIHNYMKLTEDSKGNIIIVPKEEKEEKEIGVELKTYEEKKIEAERIERKEFKERLFQGDGKDPERKYFNLRDFLVDPVLYVDYDRNLNNIMNRVDSLIEIINELKENFPDVAQVYLPALINQVDRARVQGGKFIVEELIRRIYNPLLFLQDIKEVLPVFNFDEILLNIRNQIPDLKIREQIQEIRNILPNIIPLRILENIINQLPNTPNRQEIQGVLNNLIGYLPTRESLTTRFRNIRDTLTVGPREEEEEEGDLIEDEDEDMILGEPRRRGGLTRGERMAVGAGLIGAGVIRRRRMRVTPPPIKTPLTTSEKLLATGVGGEIVKDIGKEVVLYREKKILPPPGEFQKVVQQEQGGKGTLRPKFIIPSVKILDVSQKEHQADMDEWALFDFIIPTSEGAEGTVVTNPLKKMNMIEENILFSKAGIDLYSEYGEPIQDKIPENKFIDKSNEIRLPELSFDVGKYEVKEFEWNPPQETAIGVINPYRHMTLVTGLEEYINSSLLYGVEL